MKMILFVLLLATFLSPIASLARSEYLGFWDQRYPSSDSSETACQLCHRRASGGNGWNEYGWTLRGQLAGSVNVSQFTLNGALALIEPLTSVSNLSFIQEIEQDAQPGWSEGAVNIIRLRDGSIEETIAPPDELCGLIDVGSQPIPCSIFNPLPSDIPEGDIPIQLETVATGFTSPIAAVAAPNEEGFIYVVEQGGAVVRVNLSNGQQSEFLNFSDELVSNYGQLFGGFDGFDERGLLGFAFHPGYAQNNLVYTYISKDFAPNTAHFSTVNAGENPDPQRRHLSVVSQWEINPVTNQAVETELLIVDQPQFNHNGGDLAFGPDGYLYISFGDGGGADDTDIGHGATGNGSDNTNPLGAILRIDVDDPNPANGRYGIPSQNPFVGGADSGLDEIIAYGLRNPFRFSFEELGGSRFNLYVGDVGQNEIEEIDRISSDSLGGNYGWNTKEGSFYFYPNNGQSFISDTPPPGFNQSSVVDPIAEYDHDEGLSVIGGHVYTGTEISGLENRYVFADFARNFMQPSGRLFYLDEQERIREFNLPSNIGLYITNVAKDNQNELYIVGSESTRVNSPTGALKKIVPLETISDQNPLCFPIVTTNHRAAVVCL